MLKGISPVVSPELLYTLHVMGHGDEFAPDAPPITRLERFAFYERAKQAFAILMTGELAKYGNIILKKGVTPA